MSETRYDDPYAEATCFSNPSIIDTKSTPQNYSQQHNKSLECIFPAPPIEMIAELHSTQSNSMPKSILINNAELFHNSTTHSIFKQSLLKSMVPKSNSFDIINTAQNCCHQNSEIFVKPSLSLGAINNSFKPSRVCPLNDIDTSKVIINCHKGDSLQINDEFALEGSGDDIPYDLTMSSSMKLNVELIYNEPWDLGNVEDDILKRLSVADSDKSLQNKTNFNDMIKNNQNVFAQNITSNEQRNNQSNHLNKILSSQNKNELANHKTAGNTILESSNPIFEMLYSNMDVIKENEEKKPNMPFTFNNIMMQSENHNINNSKESTSNVSFPHQSNHLHCINDDTADESMPIILSKKIYSAEESNINHTNTKVPPRLNSLSGANTFISTTNRDDLNQIYENTTNIASKELPFPPPPTNVFINSKNDNRPHEDYDAPWDQRNAINNIGTPNNLRKSYPSSVHQKGSNNNSPEHECTEVGSTPKHTNTKSSMSTSNSTTFKTEKPLKDEKWYHDKITRGEAEAKLKNKKEGSFLIRNSESNLQHYSLSIKTHSIGCIHLKIVTNQGGRFILGQFSQPFSSLAQMIQFYTDHKLPIKNAEHISLTNPISK